MTVFTTAQFSLNWNFQPGDSGWGDTFNLMVRLIDGFIGTVLISDTTSVPPVSPNDGDAYAVPIGSSGDWTSHGHEIAIYQGGDWEYYPVPTGLRVRIADRSGFYWWNGTAWTAEVTSSGGVTSVATRTGAITLTVADVSGAAALASATFSDISVPNQSAGANNAKAANTHYVDTAVSSISGGRVTSVNSHTGAVTLAYSDLGVIDWAHLPTIDLTHLPTQDWAHLPTEAQTQPIAFIIPGQPAASQAYNLVLTQATTIPANFAGTKSYQGTLATSSMSFTLNKISSGTTTAIGTITLGTGSKTSITLSTQAQASLAAGDVLQLVAPSSPDATGADIGITVQAMKV